MCWKRNISDSFKSFKSLQNSSVYALARFVQKILKKVQDNPNIISEFVAEAKMRRKLVPLCHIEADELVDYILYFLCEFCSSVIRNNVRIWQNVCFFSSFNKVNDIFSMIWTFWNYLLF